MAININTPAASAFSDLLSLALQMGSQAQERKWRSEEAERDRQFRESQIYLQNMLNQENLVIESILDAEEDAAQFGIDITEPINRLAQFQKQNATVAAQDLLNLSQDVKAQRINELIGIRSDIGKQKGFYSQGERLADMIDMNTDNIIDDTEILQFEELERFRKKDPNYVLPEPFIHGARARISDPQAQLTKLQLAGEKTRQAELGVEMERQKVTFKQATSKFQLDLTNMYRENNISSMTGTMSAADFELSSGIHQYFKGMSKAEIFDMIENSPITYTDQVPGELDYSDIDAIRPQMKGFVVKYLSDRPDVQEFLGISQDDFDASGAGQTASDNFNFAIQQGAFNAMSGFEQNANYEFKTEFITTQAKAAELTVQKQMTEDLRISFAATIPTLQNYFIDPSTQSVDIEGKIKPIARALKADKTFMAHAKSAGMNVTPYVTSLIQPLLAQADPTTVNLLITQSEDIKKIIKISGLKGMDEVVNAAIEAKGAVKAKYTPVERLSKPERTRRKKVTTSNIEYVKDITEKYDRQLSDMKIIGIGLIQQGYDPNSEQYKTMLLQELSLKLLETTDQVKVDSLKTEIEFLQKELDKIR